MSTIGQNALKRGLKALARVFPSTWTFDGEPLSSEQHDVTVARIGPDSPLMVEDPDARLKLTVTTANMPAVLPEAGDSIENGSASHRVLRIWSDVTSGQTTIILTETNGGRS
jgi:hypothetical protein